MTEYNDNRTIVENASGPISVNYESGSKIVPQYSVVAHVVKLISDGVDTSEDADRQSEDYAVDAKMEHNNLVRNVLLVDTLYDFYGGITERAFKTAEQEKPGSKNKILRKINEFYKTAVYDRGGRNKENRLKVVREHADSIVDEVVERTKDMIVHSKSVSECELEDFLSAINCVVGYAIIECQVLEKP